MRVEGLTIMWVLDKGSGNYKCQSQANERIMERVLNDTSCFCLIRKMTVLDST